MWKMNPPLLPISALRPQFSTSLFRFAITLDSRLRNKLWTQPPVGPTNDPLWSVCNLGPAVISSMVLTVINSEMIIKESEASNKNLLHLKRWRKRFQWALLLAHVLLRDCCWRVLWLTLQAATRGRLHSSFFVYYFWNRLIWASLTRANVSSVTFLFSNKRFTC